MNDRNGGVLYLLPVPLGMEPVEVALPPATTQRIRSLGRFIAESPKTARAFLKRLEHPLPLQEISITECSEHTSSRAIADLLGPLREGHAVGLLSEAGVPCVADPGALVVRAAHAEGIPVEPLVGPSSILLALMASGLSGQSFEFVGYLPVPPEERAQALRRLEQDSCTRGGQTKIFIETPYRTGALWESMLSTLEEQTRVGIALELLQPGATVQVRRVSEWRDRLSLAVLQEMKDPRAVFLLSAVPSSASDRVAGARGGKATRDKGKGQKVVHRMRRHHGK